MRVLVTGSEGFVGSHLLPALVDRGHDAVGTSRDGSSGERLDLPDDHATEALVAEHRPEAVIHLAAISHVPTAAADPGGTWRTNVEGVRCVHRALERLRPDAALLFVSTGAVYGPAEPEEGPADESRPCRPTNAYAWSKLAAEAALTMAGSAGPRIIIARPFNHSGPRQSEDFALPSFARQIADAERSGGTGVVRTGDLDPLRDFLDVRDVVEAYIRLLEVPGARGVFNVCSGEASRIGDLLELLRAASTADISVTADAARRRPEERPPVLGSSERLRRTTGWSPRHSLDAMVGDLLVDWRTRLADAV